MAQVELPKGIAAIHGRMGDYVFKTRGGKTYVYYMPKKRRTQAKKSGTHAEKKVLSLVNGS